MFLRLKYIQCDFHYNVLTSFYPPCPPPNEQFLRLSFVRATTGCHVVCISKFLPGITTDNIRLSLSLEIVSINSLNAVKKCRRKQ